MMDLPVVCFEPGDYLQDAKNGEKCWSLFKSIAVGSAELSQEQQQIGKLIVAKCSNVPFLVKVVASLLRQRGCSLVEWSYFADDKRDIIDLCNLYERDYWPLFNVFRRPSCDQPEPPLITCFSYCSAFPKEYEFNRIDLIRHWVAQEFVPSLDDGNKYFNDLLDMGFFQELKLDALGDIVTCKMNHVVRYLSSRLAGCKTDASPSYFDDVERTWYMSVSIGFNDVFPRAALHALNLRTLVVLGKPRSRPNVDRKTLSKLLSHFKTIRVLDLHNCGIDLLPSKVGDLVHLRYLDISHNGSLVSLPSSITRLHNLQVLKLDFCDQLKSLPKDIGKLVMLRSLQIDGCYNLTYMPLGLRKLTRLESLSRFVVCRSKGNVNGGIRALGTLKNLQGKLKIELSGEWTTFVHEAPLANLNDRKLNELEIKWVEGQEDNHCYYEALLEAFKPPSTLQSLCIEGYKGKNFPKWSMMGKLSILLPKLVMVSISGCTKSKHLPLFGQLKYLKFLTLKYMEEVEFIEAEPFSLSTSSSSSSTCFYESLQELTLRSCRNLKGWWKEVGELDVLPHFPRLLKVTIWNCPKLSFIPMFPCAEEVVFQNVDWELLDECRFENLPNLKSMHIKGCSNMKKFPTLGLKCRTSIKSLVIDNCDSLTSLNGFEGLTSLEKLEISHCKELIVKDMPGNYLNNLCCILFRAIPKMERLPQGLQWIITLKSLSIVNCNALKELPEWLDQIRSLKLLKIEACYRLTSLPVNMENLKLEKLEVINCPELMKSMKSCRESHAKLWSKLITYNI